MSKLLLKIFLFIILIFGACSGQKNDVKYPGIASGKYNFNMYDSNDVIVASGVLDIKDKSKNEISGTFQFTIVISEFQCYEFMNKGLFTGKVNDKEKSVLINTNPGQADRNVFFNIELDKIPYTGTWYCSQFRNNSNPNKITLSKN